MVRISLDIELNMGILLQQLRYFVDIGRTDMALVRARMDSDAGGAGLYTQLCSAKDRRNTQMTRIANQRHFIHIDRQCGDGFMVGSSHG